MGTTGIEAPIKIERPTVSPGRLFIGGKWREAQSGKRREVIDPSTGKVITTIAEGGVEDLNEAVDAARKAFDDGAWAKLSGRERSRLLLRVAEIIRRRADELTKLESIDVGKPITLSRTIDVETTIQLYELYAALAQSGEGHLRDMPGGAVAQIRREPLGVVGAITPFNFPLVLSNTKIAPALASGNSVIHKPASDTSLSALLMAEIFSEAGIPEGVINVITGPGFRVGDAMIRHPKIDKIAFTGSTEVGREVARVTAESLKPATLELGGKSAHIIFEDADLEKAINAAIQGFTFNTGQFCMAGTRLLVARKLFDQVVKTIANTVASIRLGDPFDSSTVIGPMVSEKQLRNCENYVHIALEEEKATVVAGGKRIDKGGGFFYPPTVIIGVTNESRLVQEEIFGPVVTVQPFDNEDEAIRMANSTKYGLAAGLHSRDPSRISRVVASLKAGTVWVNGWGILDPTVPFGGTKQSGFGREYGPEALHYYTQVKSTIIAP